MSYCLHPGCQQPLNPQGANFCQSCGAPLVPLLRNRYRIIRPLSGGGFGRTFLAEDYDKLNEICVVKQLAPQIQGTSALQKAIRLFEEEARRLQQLGEHPQIPTLYAYFEQDKYLYLVQQFIPGQTLRQELEHGVFSEQKIWQLLADLLPVLKFIHEHHVIHRDIKLENVIRRQTDGKLVLIDFGVAKQVTATAIASGTIIGSFGYASIEQMQTGTAYPASDLYSLGVTCFYLLTHVSPSQLWTEQGYSWVSNWQQYLRSPISQQLKQVLDKLLQKDIQQRYQFVDQVIPDLQLQPQAVTPTLLPSSAPRVVATEAATTLPYALTQPFVNSYLRLSALCKYKLIIGGIMLALGFAGYRYWQWRSAYTLIGHQGEVNAIAFSPDGQEIASGSDDKTIKVWNLNTGKAIRTLTGHSNWVYTVAISPDGKNIVSGSKDNTIKIWNLNTGKELRTLRGHSSFVNSVAITPNGQQIVSGSYDKTIKVWNLNTGQELRTFKGHVSEVLTVAISPDGQQIVSGSTDRTIKVWNLNTGQAVRTLKGHVGDVNSIAISSNGQEIVSVSDDKSIKLWNLTTGREIRTLTGYSADINVVAFIPNSYKIATGSDDKTVRIWNLITGEELTIFKGHSAPVWSVTFSPVGQTLVSGSADKTIKIWRGYE